MFRLPQLAPLIAETASGLLPTPTVRGNYNKPRPGAKSGYGLDTATRLLPTPCARDWRSGKGRDWNGHSPQLPEVVGGLLNPLFVEWMMGFPAGWTDCEPSATPSSPTSQSG